MQLEEAREKYREILNDPAIVTADVECCECGLVVVRGEAAFSVENYYGEYVGYVCPVCHPNRKWIWALWRGVLGVDLLQVPVDVDRRKNGVISRSVH